MKTEVKEAIKVLNNYIEELSQEKRKLLSLTQNAEQIDCEAERLTAMNEYSENFVRLHPVVKPGTKIKILYSRSKKIEGKIVTVTNMFDSSTYKYEWEHGLWSNARSSPFYIVFKLKEFKGRFHSTYTTWEIYKEQ
jgi:hypothetical protein